MPGHSISVTLRREGYRALASFAWVQTAQFGALAGRAGEFLHAEELETFSRAKSRKAPNQGYLLGRFTAKSALGICAGPGFDPTAAVILSGIFSQPVVHCRVPRPLGVSISHSDSLVCSLAYPEEHPMAIDVEDIDEDRTKVMLTQVGRAEGDLARSVCASADLAATVVWTAKEALSKALRCGMTCPYELFEICGLEAVNSVYVGRFKNFGQYKFQSWRRGNAVVTIVLPKKTEMEPSLPDVL